MPRVPGTRPSSKRHAAPKTSEPAESVQATVGGTEQRLQGVRDKIAVLMRRVEEVVGQHFADALNALKAALGIIAIGCLADNRQPTTLILVGRSGAGKSMALNFLMPRDDRDKLAEFLYRSDKLTAASFVSHK